MRTFMVIDYTLPAGEYSAPGVVAALAAVEAGVTVESVTYSGPGEGAPLVVRAGYHPAPLTIEGEAGNYHGEIVMNLYHEDDFAAPELRGRIIGGFRLPWEAAQIAFPTGFHIAGPTDGNAVLSALMQAANIQLLLTPGAPLAAAEIVTVTAEQA